MRDFLARRARQVGPHLWLGTSIEGRRELARLEDLRSIPAVVRFVSFEPLLEDLGPIDLTGISSVIAGAESGAGTDLWRLTGCAAFVTDAAGDHSAMIFVLSGLLANGRHQQMHGAVAARQQLAAARVQDRRDGLTRPQSQSRRR